MAEVFKPRPGLHRFPDSNDLREYLDRLNKGIHSGVTSVRGGARWVARDWHWAGIVPPIGLLVGISQAENISQAAIQAWQTVHPVRPVEKVIANPQADSIVVPIASPMVEPTALPTPQAPKPESKAGAGPSTPDDDPNKTQVKDDIKPKADDVKQTEEPKPPKIEPTPKPLPEVINDETVKYEKPNSGEIQKRMTRAKAEGKNKLAMPEAIEDLSVKEVSSPGNATVIAASIKGSPGKIEFDLPALSKGKVHGVSKGNLFSVIGVESEDGEGWGYIVPSSSSLKYENNEDVDIGTLLVSLKYDPNDPNIAKFIKFLQTQAPGADPNTLFMVAGKSGTPGLKKAHIMTSDSGEVTLVTTQKK